MGPRKIIFESIRRRLSGSSYLRDVLWQASGNTAAQVLGIAAMPALTRLYEPSDFAALNIFSQVVAGLAILMTLRFEYLVMQPADQTESDRVLRLTCLLGALNVVWLTPLLSVLPSYWSWLQRQGEIADWLWLAPISALALSLAVGLQQAVQRRGDFKTSAVSEFCGRCAYVASALLGALALSNIAGLMLSSLANAGGKLAWLFNAGRDLPQAVWRPGRIPVSRSVCQMAWSTSASSLISLVSGFAPMIFIADRYGANALGQYGLVIATLYLPGALLGQAIGQVYFQRACRLHGAGLGFTSIVIETSGNLAKVGVPLYTLIAIVSPIAYPLVFGAQWASAGEIARWLCLASLAAFISTPLDRTSIVTSVWWYLSAWHIMRAVMTVTTLVISVKLALSFEAFILLLSIQNAGAYCIDWGASYMFSVRAASLRKHDGTRIDS